MSNLQYLLYNLSQCSNYWSAGKAPKTPSTGVKTLSRRYYKFTATQTYQYVPAWNQYE